MTTQEDYMLRFHTETPAEAEARRKDPTWHRTHWFSKGWGWSRGDGAAVMMDDCLDFEKLAEAEKEAVWQRVKAALEKRRAELRANPIVVPMVTELTMPVIRSVFPTNVINDLVGVQPMTAPRNA